MNQAASVFTIYAQSMGAAQHMSAKAAIMKEDWTWCARYGIFASMHLASRTPLPPHYFPQNLICQALVKEMVAADVALMKRDPEA